MYVASCSTLARRVALAALALTCIVAGPSVAAAQEQPAPQPQQQAAPGLVFASDAGMILNYIKADQTAVFEEVMGKIKEALAKSEDPVRKQQAAGWKVFKAVEPGPNGASIYIFVMDPVVKDADYGMAKILVEAFPQEARALWDKLTPAYAGSNRLNLQVIQRFGQ